MPINYLISRTLDPIFALGIGATSAWVRIRREESERRAVAADIGQPSHFSRISSLELWNVLKQRVQHADFTNWDFRKGFNRKEKWGIVDP